MVPSHCHWAENVTWQADGAGHRREILKYYEWSYQDVLDATQLEEWLAVVDSAQAEPEIATQIDILVGTHQIGQVRSDLPRHAYRLLNKAFPPHDQRGVLCHPTWDDSGSVTHTSCLKTTSTVNVSGFSERPYLSV